MLNTDSPLYGIINVSVANMRQHPVYQSELVNQIILGTVVPIFEEQNEFYYIQNWDGYLGWISKASVVAVNREAAENWQESPQVIFKENYGFVSKSIDHESELITDLVPCAIMKMLQGNSEFTKVEVPDGRIGYVRSDFIVHLETQQSVRPTKQSIINISMRFLGIPYLWGGTSAKAFDCSGFVQTVFRLHNVELPRNANQMAETGKEITVGEDFENLDVGDLLFFGKTLKRITHVALFMGNRSIIHSEGVVRMNSLDPEHSLYNEFRHKTFLKANRIL